MDTAGEVLEAVRLHLRSYSLEFTYDKPAFMTDPGMSKGMLRYVNGSTLLRVVTIAPMTLTALARANLDEEFFRSTELPVLLVGRIVHEKSAAAFRELGISFADTLGNTYIRLPSVLVDVRGRRQPPDVETATSRTDDPSASRSANLFSTGRAQVVAALLAWPDLADGPVREVAWSAGVSTGQAHGALALLGDAGYLVGREMREDRAAELADLWTAAYTQGLGRKLAVASYRSINGTSETRDDVLRRWAGGHDAYDLQVSGESVPGLGIKQPLSLTVYARDWTPRQAVQLRWRAASTAAEADVHVRRRFWRSPHEGRTSDQDHSVAPWPIVCADLASAGDPRLAEVADEWRRRHQPERY